MSKIEGQIDNNLAWVRFLTLSSSGISRPIKQKNKIMENTSNNINKVNLTAAKIDQYWVRKVPHFNKYLNSEIVWAVLSDHSVI